MKVDMSPEAVSARLSTMGELWELSVALMNAKISPRKPDAFAVMLPGNRSSRVRIQIFHENGGAGGDDRKLVKTVWIERSSHKKLTSKQAGRLLANSFPDFDELINRDGLTKTDDGFYASRALKPLDKCNYHFVWEIAFVNEESEEETT